MSKLKVLNQEVTITSVKDEDYISLTDIAKHRNADDPRFIIQNWMRSRSTIEFLGIWEILNNPNFNRVDFEAVKNIPFFCLPSWFAEYANRKPHIKAALKGFGDGE